MTTASPDHTPLVYLAGPMRGFPQFNFPEFDRWAGILRDLGFAVISPAEMDREAGIDEKTLSDADITQQMKREFMSRDCEAVCQADAVAVMPGWDKSHGAMIEVSLASVISIPVIDVVTMREYGPGAGYIQMRIQELQESGDTSNRVKTGTETRRDILKQIESCVCKDRQNSYGDAEDNFEHIRELWAWWLHRRGLIDSPEEITRLDVAQMSSMIKIARKVGNLEYLDNWIDDAGYNVCGGGIAVKQASGK
jgi:nucleoside 2-deoxyribosyltransferase